MSGIVPVKAQQSVEVSAGADVVSSYIWRGVYQTGFSLQPSLGVGYKGFSLGAWASTDLDDFKEFDLTLGYSTGGLSLSVTDYWWDGQGAKYFADYDRVHRFEGTVAYTFGERFPLTAAWSTMFAGDDEKENGDRAYSTYVELSYPFSVGPVDLSLAVGAAPWKSPSWLPEQGSGFRVANIALTASKAIKVTERYSIPVFTRLSANPATDDVNLVVGVSF